MTPTRFVSVRESPFAPPFNTIRRATAWDTQDTGDTLVSAPKDGALHRWCPGPGLLDSGSASLTASSACTRYGLGNYSAAKWNSGAQQAQRYS